MHVPASHREKTIKIMGHLLSMSNSSLTNQLEIFRAAFLFFAIRCGIFYFTFYI